MKIASQTTEKRNTSFETVMVTGQKPKFWSQHLMIYVSSIIQHLVKYATVKEMSTQVKLCSRRVLNITTPELLHQQVLQKHLLQQVKKI
jgi:hypothetical protein